MTKSSTTTPSLRDKKKGYPKHECCRKKIFIYIYALVRKAPFSPQNNISKSRKAGRERLPTPPPPLPPENRYNVEKLFLSNAKTMVKCVGGGREEGRW